MGSMGLTSDYSYSPCFSKKCKTQPTAISPELTTWTEVIELRKQAADLGFRWTQPEAYDEIVRRLARAEDALEWQRLTARYEGKVRELPA